MAHVNETHRLRDLDYEFLQHYNMTGPRYTSYPTAPVWNDSVDSDAFIAHLDSAKSDWKAPLSLYLHLPFCFEHCTFCACNVIISPKGREVSEPYLRQIEREIEMQAEHNDPDRPVVQFHWGGGTPTYLDVEQIEALYQHVANRFNITEGCERSIEVHPPVTTDDQIRLLARLGFNRLSMGVQDFNEKTQQAINRIQSFERTKEITDLARELGFTGINYDLVYGLPYQTAATFSSTIDRVLELRPDRLALYNFAFLPGLLPHQRVIDAESLPSPEEKFQIFLDAHDRFLEAGYVYIGMDHFALPEDELAIAANQGTLRRNFMGFTTQAGTDLIGMGVSAISSVSNLFAQNVKKLTQYTKAIEADQLPTERGYLLSKDDQLRQRVISDLMCKSSLSKREISDEFGVAFDEYFSRETGELIPLEQDELLKIDGDRIELTFLGRLLSRNVAMPFDAYLQAQREQTKRPMFSRTL